VTQSSDQKSQPATELVRSLGLGGASGLVVGTVIGTGVFIKAAIMLQQTGSPVWVLLAWLIAGLLSLAGALCYAELGVLFPRAGGEYVYLRHAYGDTLAFLFGWMRFWIGSTGSIAAYAVGAATFLNAICPLAEGPVRGLVAVGFIAFFTLTNCFSVAFGGKIQSFLTVLKVLMIVCLAGTIFIFTPGSKSSADFFSSFAHSFSGHWNGLSAFGSAMIAALWAYDGWNNMPMAAGEIKDPNHAIPRALGIGMGAILVLYLAVNLAYFYALPSLDIAHSYSQNYPNALPVASRVMEILFGSCAVKLLSIGFIISALGAMNGSVLTGARIPFAMARDGLFFQRLGTISESAKVPMLAVVVQGAIAAALAMSGTFDQLTDYVVFSSWIFYALVTASLFKFRKKIPLSERTYTAPFYPFLPLLFIACSILLLLNTLVNSPRESGLGLIFIGLGYPVYLWFRRGLKSS
jgi:APA family basic amino acid/polyamine antiporter